MSSAPKKPKTSKKKSKATQGNNSAADDAGVFLRPDGYPTARRSNSRGSAVPPNYVFSHPSSGIPVGIPPAWRNHLLTRALCKVPIFRKLNFYQITRILNSLHQKLTFPSERIVCQGHIEHRCYIVESGTFSMIKHTPTFGDVTMKTYHNSGNFGQLSALFEFSSPYSIVSHNHGILWYVRRDVVLSILRENNFSNIDTLFQEPSLFLQQLRSSYFMKCIPEEMTHHVYRSGTLILAKGTPSIGTCFIESGEVMVCHEASNGLFYVTGKLATGKKFGSPLLGTLNDANIYAVGETHIALLKPGAYGRLLEPFVELIDSFYIE